jgi:hypothetical protein
MPTPDFRALKSHSQGPISEKIQTRSVKIGLKLAAPPTPSAIPRLLLWPYKELRLTAQEWISLAVNNIPDVGGVS